MSASESDTNDRARDRAQRAREDVGRTEGEEERQRECERTLHDTACARHRLRRGKEREIDLRADWENEESRSSCEDDHKQCLPDLE